MSKLNIAKISLFVILAALALSACGSGAKREKVEAKNPNFDTPRVVGRISSKDIPESSGVAGSRCQSNVLWTHNDSGNGNYIFAIDLAGKLLGTYRVKDTKNRDWEDIATFKDVAGKCYVYIGEIGDNDEKRSEHEVYRVPEPIIDSSSEASDTGRPIETAVPEAVRFRYPDKPQNAETLMVQPVSGDIYVATKHESGPASIYKVKPVFGTAEAQIAEKVAEISVPAVPNGLLTGGDISPDGRHAILCDYTQGYELTLPDGSGNFDDIWKQTPAPVDLGKRPHGESVAYNVDGTAVYATSENANAPIIEVKRK